MRCLPGIVLLAAGVAAGPCESNDVQLGPRPEAGRIVPSEHARNAREAGLDIVTWTLERSGILADGDNGFYYQTIDDAISHDGDVMAVIDVLARDVVVRGIFSDWPATVSFYASCAGLD